MKDILALSDRQLQEVTAAAASLRVESRDQFLRDIASQLAPLKRQPTDADVAAAINQTIGVTPVYLCDSKEGVSHATLSTPTSS